MKDITLHCICKDETKQIDRIIKDYRKYFGELHFAVDDEKVFKEIQTIYHAYPEVKFFHYTHRNEDGMLDFAHKRNFLVEQCKTDYYFRLDTDDSIINPEAIAELVKYCQEGKVSFVTCYYDYSVDEWGNTNAAHYRETIIRNTPNLYWNKPIHENILPRSPSDLNIIRDDKIKIKHNIDRKHSESSARRNLAYLIKEYNRDKEKTDSRTLAYLGRTFLGLGYLDQAIFFLEKHIQTSGWDDDRYLSWCHIAEILKLKGNFKQALAAAFEALQENEEFPDAYFMIHDIYFIQEKWQKALNWATVGFSKPFPETNMFVDPSSYTWRPMLSTAECYFQIGEFEKAMQVFEKAEKIVPDFNFKGYDIKQVRKVYETGLEHHRFVDKIMWMAMFLKDKAPDNLTNLVNAIPKELYQHDIIAKLRAEVLPPKVWQRNEVAIFCPSYTEVWTPKSVTKGIGGSEEAVIHISKELTKLGYKVTVFNNCGEEEGEYDGVLWQNIVRFNFKDKFNIVIAWRHNLFETGLAARRKIIWIHDLPHNIVFNKDSIKTFDKIIVLSKYHASLLPEVVPKDKIFISTNGINPQDFEGLDNIPRQKHRVIYASSYNRGLEELLQMWPDVRKEVPDAELHIYYGWDIYLKWVREGAIKDDGFYERMLKLMAQDGVYEHGRIGHKPLLEEYAKSGVFAYPCTYAGEINCIALTKAIACGCQCLTNDKFAVGERNSHFTVPDGEFKHMLIRILKGEYRLATDTKKYIAENTWRGVAESWNKDLFPPDLDIEITDREQWVEQYFDKKKDKDTKIIDIGANQGQSFKGWDRKNITSVDLDEYEYEGFIQANAESLPFEDKQFDRALLGEIVEHCENPVKALSEAKRVAKEAVITVPYEYEWKDADLPFATIEDREKAERRSREEMVKRHNPAKRFYEGDNYKHLFHNVYYTPELLENHLKEAGFTDYKITKLRWRGNAAWLGAVAR